MLSEQDRNDCDMLLEDLKAMERIVLAYRYSDETKDLKNLTLYFKSLAREMLTHWV